MKNVIIFISVFCPCFLLAQADTLFEATFQGKSELIPDTYFDKYLLPSEAYLLPRAYVGDNLTSDAILPDLGVDSSMWFDESTGEAYEKLGGSWVNPVFRYNGFSSGIEATVTAASYAPSISSSHVSITPPANAFSFLAPSGLNPGYVFVARYNNTDATGDVVSFTTDYVDARGNPLPSITVSGNSGSVFAFEFSNSKLVYIGGSFSNPVLSDADGDTKIQVEESADDDVVRIDAGGDEVARFSNIRTDFDRRTLQSGAGALNGASAAQITISNTSAIQSAHLYVDDAGDFEVYTNGTSTPQLLIENTGTGVGINTANADASAALDVTSTTQGILPPRMTGAQRDAISTPAAGLFIYNTDDNEPNYYNGTSWYHTGYGELGLNESTPDTITFNVGSTTPDSIAAAKLITGDTLYFTKDGSTLKCIADGPGVYSVVATASFSFTEGGGGTIIHGGLRKNGIEDSIIRFGRTIGSSGQIGDATASGLISLTTNDRLTFMFNPDTHSGDDDLIITEFNISIHRIK